jgi:hypothetical protein
MDPRSQLPERSAIRHGVADVRHAVHETRSDMYECLMSDTIIPRICSVPGRCDQCSVRTYRGKYVQPEIGCPTEINHLTDRISGRVVNS